MLQLKNLKLWGFSRLLTVTVPYPLTCTGTITNQNIHDIQRAEFETKLNESGETQNAIEYF
jgi:hypothetical protein